jgi:N-methylhydantoinase B/oxoprolinase/acetone carboxylase alpha subunit
MTVPTLTASSRGPVDPVLLEIVSGSLAAIEKEVETAIGRTSRSPMIRDPRRDSRQAAAQADRPLLQRTCPPRRA